MRGNRYATYCRCRLLFGLVPRSASGSSRRPRRVAFLRRTWGLTASARRAGGSPYGFGVGQLAGLVDRLLYES